MSFQSAATTFALVLLVGTTASAQSWLREFIAADAAPDDVYGSSVAVDQSLLVVGAPWADATGTTLDSGRAYVYRQLGSSWVEEARLTPSDPTTAGLFGVSVAMMGNTIAVGAPGARAGGVPQGAVYMFERVGGAWTEVARLSAADALWGDEFGASLDLDGSLLLVGAPGRFGIAANSGAAYLFERLVVWSQQAKFVASDSEELDRFGEAVAIYGTRAAVGAPSEDDPIKESGAVYIYEGFGTVWNEVAKLKPADAVPFDAFGSALALWGERLIAGAPGGTWVGVKSGSVVMYESSVSGWLQLDRILPNDLGAGDRFGTAVSMHADKLIVGGPRHDGSSGDSGAAWFFGWAGTNWLQLATLSAPSPGPHYNFGSSVSLSSSRLAVGSPYTSSAMNSAGSVDLWSTAGGAQHTVFCFGVTCPCGNEDQNGGCFNSTGRGARLGASGSLSLAHDDLRITTTDLAAAQFVVLFMGPAQTSSLFGDGLRCADAGGPLGPGYRLLGPPQLAGPGGIVSVGPGRFQSVPGVAPGVTRYLQSWYRDSAGPCGSSFNVSNAIAVTFTP